MINILRLRPKDIECEDLKDSKRWEAEYNSKYGSIDDVEILSKFSNLELFDFARLKVNLAMTNEQYKNDFMNIYLDDEMHTFVVSFDGFDKDAKEALELVEVDAAYLPVRKVFINQHWNDPFVHYDAKESIFSLPANVFIHNIELLVELGMSPDSVDSWEPSNEIEELLSYDDDRNIWVYSLTGVELDKVYSQYKKYWNYMDNQNVDNHDGGIIAYDKDGNSHGRVYAICSVNLADILVMLKGSKSLENIISGQDYTFVSNSNVSNEAILMYISEPTDAFMLVFGVIGSENSAILPVSVYFKDYENITDRMVYEEEGCNLYVPIRSVGVDVIYHLHKLGYSWSKEDRDSTGYFKNKLTEDVQQRLLEEAIKDFEQYGVEKSIQNILDKLIKLYDLDASSMDYESLMEMFIDLFYDRLEELKVEMDNISDEIEDIDKELEGLQEELDKAEQKKKDLEKQLQEVNTERELQEKEALEYEEQLEDDVVFD